MNWIKPIRDFGDICPTYVKLFDSAGLDHWILQVTAHGIYEVMLNGERVSDYVLAPGWTEKRLQFQTYKLTNLIEHNNVLSITVGRGWYRSPLAGWREESRQDPRLSMPPGLCVKLQPYQYIEQYEQFLANENTNLNPNGITFHETNWTVMESPVRFSELYDGEHYDARFEFPESLLLIDLEDVEPYLGPDMQIVKQEGEEIHESDKFYPTKIITTPKGETVIDFGQNITGYVEFKLPPETEAGQEVKISFAETLDADGNFYTENYRSAKSQLHYTCKQGVQSYKPKLTFFGFRYIRLDEFPAGICINPKNFTAIAVYSNITRTGWINSSSHLLNRFFENVIWGQKGNFLDIPTDCPQRDERLGWTGDAQVFIKTAAYNFNVYKFFKKWLADLSLAQLPNGLIPHVVPDCQGGEGGSAAWADAAVIIPWHLYTIYGNKEILHQQWDSMVKWQNYITNTTQDEYLWIGGKHFGDWLSLELPPPTVPDIRRGATRHDFLASAFYAHTTELLIKAGKVINKDVSAYESLYQKIVQKFRQTFKEDDYRTQTEYILALHFNLTENPQSVADEFAKKVATDGCLKTGFVGTPYILHVLSRYGYTELAYTLLLRENYPSWLYPITKGATTIWERWDSIKPDGSFQTANMNSFNHYAYGAVADWIYEVAAGIKFCIEKITITPHPDPRLQWLEARIDTVLGTITSKWEYTNGHIRYEITTPDKSEIIINGKSYIVKAGTHIYIEDCNHDEIQ